LNRPVEPSWEGGPGLLTSVARGWPFLLGTGLLAASIALYVDSTRPEVYAASTTITLDDPQAPSVLRDVGPRVVDVDRYLASQADLAGSASVLRAAAATVGGGVTDRQLRRSIEVVAAEEAYRLVVNAQDADPGRATRMADAVARTYERFALEHRRRDATRAVRELARVEQELRAKLAEASASEIPPDADRERDALLEQIAETRKQMDAIRLDAALYGSGVQLISAPDEPEQPVSPRGLRDAAISAALGLLLAALILFWRAERVPTAESESDCERALGVPLLGTLPAPRRLWDRRSSTQARASAYGMLALALDLASLEKPRATVVISGVRAGDGATDLSLQLAMSLAHDGGRQVTLADADLEARSLTSRMGAEEELGFADLPESTTARGWAPLAPGGTFPSGLRFVPAGRRGSAVSASTSVRVAQACEELTDLSPDELLLIDAPPLLAGTAAMRLVGCADAALVVVSGGTQMHLLDEVRRRLELTGVAPTWFVFEERRRRRQRRLVRARRAVHPWLEPRGRQPRSDASRVQPFQTYDVHARPSSWEGRP
jgi:Mrp family chromosome partitioning ATPase